MSTKPRELKHNDLADAIGSSVDQYKGYAKPIIGTVVAIAVLALLFQYSRQQSALDRANEWAQYLAATNASDTNELKALGEKSSGSLASGWALIALGDQKVSQAMNDLTSNRGEVRNSFQDAKEAYDKARKLADVEIQQRGTLGFAKAQEGLGELKSATEAYKEVVSKWPSTVFAAIAQQRLQDLDRNTVKDFYDWLARKENDVPKQDGPGVPGLRPGGIDNLKGDTGDFKFSSPLDLNKPNTSDSSTLPPAAEKTDRKGNDPNQPVDANSGAPAPEKK